MRLALILIVSLILAPAAQAKTVIGMGDSITWGFGAWPTAPGYAKIVATEIEKQTGSEVQYHNLAKNGATSSELLERIALAQALDPNVVLISIGGNDMLSAMEAGEDVLAAIEQAAANAQRAILALKPKERSIVILGLFNPYPPYARMHEYGEHCIRHYEEVFREVAEETGAVFVPLADAFAGNERGLTWTDRADIHPTPMGHKLIADLVLQILGYEPSGYEPLEEPPWLMANDRLGYIHFLTMTHWFFSGLRLAEDGFTFYIPQGNFYQNQWIEIGYDNANAIKAGAGVLFAGKLYVSTTMLLTGPREFQLQIAVLDGIVPLFDSRITLSSTPEVRVGLHYAM